MNDQQRRPDSTDPIYQAFLVWYDKNKDCPELELEDAFRAGVKYIISKWGRQVMGNG